MPGPCPQCGYELSPGREICEYHNAGYGDGWAASNKIWCDYFHRGVPITRLSVPDDEITEITYEEACYAARDLQGV